MGEYIINIDKEEARWKSSGTNYSEYLNNKVISFIGNPVMERVVRCKNCKFFGKREACVMFPMQTIRMIHPSENGFCAWGKRKEY